MKKDGMVAASKITAAYETENEDYDSVARGIAREIIEEAIR